MYEKHPQFKPPKSDSVKIWRYMDFSKFVSILDKNGLFFAKASLFEDPYEGLYSSSLQEMHSFLKEHKEVSWETDIRRAFLEIAKIKKDNIYINCWHMFEVESAAMWELYSKGGEGIAIQSSFGGLKECFSQCNFSVYIGKVKYIDWTVDKTPYDKMFLHYLTKRKIFIHENEIRAIINGFYIKNNEVYYSDNKNTLLKCDFDIENGVYVNVSLDSLIEKIFVSPKSPKWFLDLVKSVSKKYGLSKEVIRSDLYDGPLY